MNNLKIVNKNPILTDVRKIDDNCILLKFNNKEYFDLEDDVYELKIFGNGVAQNIDLIKEYNLNTETVVVDEIKELDFFVGNMTESPDWGDWNLHFSIPFETYSGTFSKKDKEDWENELIYLLTYEVTAKAFESVTDIEFRNAKFRQARKIIEDNQIERQIKEDLILFLNKIQSLDIEKFYNVFMNGYKID